MLVTLSLALPYSSFTDSATGRLNEIVGAFLLWDRSEFDFEELWFWFELWFHSSKLLIDALLQEF